MGDRSLRHTVHYAIGYPTVSFCKLRQYLYDGGEAAEELCENQCRRVIVFVNVTKRKLKIIEMSSRSRIIIRKEVFITVRFYFILWKHRPMIDYCLRFSQSSVPNISSCVVGRVTVKDENPN